MTKSHIGEGQVRGSRSGRRPPAGPRRTCQPRLERLETRCLPGFLAPLAFDAGGDPRSVAMGDFNGDGIPDLAVANYGGTVSVLLGQGDGTFQKAVNYAAGAGPFSVAVGDFNGDGIFDLAVANIYSNNLSVLLGKGDGTFLPAVNYPAGTQPDSVAVGDFNGDGIPDLAIANRGTYPNYTDGSVSILLGKGDGTFLTAQSYAAGISPWSVAVGDFNGDGIKDLAVANNAYYGTVSVLLGKGDGTFLAAVNYSAGASPSSVAVGDFNGDGKPDLAVANSGSNNVSVLRGQGDGTFLPAQTFPAGASPRSLAVGDFNGDGIPDLAVANGSGVSVLLGQGDGTFLPAQSYAAGSEPSAVAVGDFNGDGKQDLAVANAYSNNVSVLLGKADGTFLAADNYSAGASPSSVAVGDFNGDGILDLAVADYAFNGTVSVLLGQGDGTFLPAQSYTAGTRPRSVAVGDFNGDGKLDLAVANYGISGGNGTVSVLLGKGDGTFYPAASFPAGQGPRSVAVGDFNGDGHLDLAVAGYLYAGYLDYPDQTVRVLLGKGDGTFLPAQSYPAEGNPVSVAVGDFNGDGKQDLAVADFGDINGSGRGVRVLLGQGDGTFLPAAFYPAVGRPVSVAVGDFNGDGKLDLAVANEGIGFITGGVSVLLGKGDGTFLPAVNYPTGGSNAVAVGDFNGDGKLDLAVLSSGTVRVLLGNGDGTFQTTNVSYAAGSEPSSVAVGDFNGDGFPDLAVANQTYAGTVSILLNDATWAGGPGRARGGPSRPLFPQPLLPPAVLPFPSGEDQRLAASALLAVAPSPGNRPLIEPPAPLSLPGADPPPPAILPVLLWEGRPSALTDPQAGPRARGGPWTLDHLFAGLAANGLWDDGTDQGTPLLA
jgi:hypothetical protein